MKRPEIGTKVTLRVGTRFQHAFWGRAKWSRWHEAPPGIDGTVVAHRDVGFDVEWDWVPDHGKRVRAIESYMPQSGYVRGQGGELL